MAQLCTDFAPLSNLLSLLTLGSYKIFIPKFEAQARTNLAASLHNLTQS
jgi:uncharacterized membrane protein YqhA